MITPEKQRRRERMLGAGMVVLGLGIAYNSHHIEKQGDEFQECITQQVQALTTAMDARANLNEAESAATRRVILTVATSSSRDEFREALAAYVRVQDEIEKQRRDNPVPAFPDGRCQE